MSQSCKVIKCLVGIMESLVPLGSAGAKEIAALVRIVMTVVMGLVNEGFAADPNDEQTAKFGNAVIAVLKRGQMCAEGFCDEIRGCRQEIQKIVEDLDLGGDGGTSIPAP